MGKGRGKKLFRIILFIGAAIPVFAAAALFYSYPVVAAVVCPSCFGMERASDRLVADKGLVEARRAALLADLQRQIDAVPHDRLYEQLVYRLRVVQTEAHLRWLEECEEAMLVISAAAAST